MPEASLVPEFLKDFALKRNFAVHDCVYGSINLGRSFPIEQSCGAVYGIWASSPTPIRTGLASHTRLPSVVSGLLGQGHHASQPFEGACPRSSEWKHQSAKHSRTGEFTLVFGSILLPTMMSSSVCCTRAFRRCVARPGRASVDGRESACLIARAPPGQVAGRVPGVPRDGGVPGFLDGQWGCRYGHESRAQVPSSGSRAILSMEPDGAQAGLIEYSRVKETVTESRPHRTA